MGAGKGSGGENFVNPVYKYLLFFSHVLFWFLGVVLIGVGSWGFSEKQRYGDGTVYHEDFDFYQIVFDLTIVMIILGIVVFCLSFAGCLGALRENVTLLKIFSYTLSVLFLLELICALLAFIFSAEVKAKLTQVLKEEAIVRYRDDIDLQNMMDWVQKTVNCCGVSSNGYRDWTNNEYFMCNPKNPSTNPSIERCAVPYSCCRNPDNMETSLINTLCGADQQLFDYRTANKVIYVDGCVDAVIDVVKQKLYIFGGIFLAVAIPQLMGIFLARILCNQIEDTKESSNIA
ncbi:Tetraspanin-33 [Lamellibrachia satsuma]|nr:Tetraspanin-33 [Lamellibrachia satsuma]